MNIKLTGATINIDLNDDVNYSVTEYTPAISRVNVNSQYPDVEETLRITVRGVDIAGVVANVKALLALQNATDEDLLLTVVSHDDTEYRTKVVSLDVDVPSSYFMLQTWQGLPEATITINRRGLWLGEDFDTYTQPEAGYSGELITLSGFRQQNAYAPTDITVSGIWGGAAVPADVQPALSPHGYIIAAGRTDPAKAAMVHCVVDRMFGVAVYPDGWDGYGWDFVEDGGALHPASVGFWSYGTAYSPTSILFPTYGFERQRPEVMTLINSYERVHVFGSMRNLAPTGWIVDFLAAGVGLPRNRVEFFAVSQAVSVAPVGATSPAVYYLGTIMRPKQTEFSDVVLRIGAEEDYTSAAYPGVQPMNKRVVMGDLYFVGDSGEASIIKIDARAAKINRYQQIDVRANYITGTPIVEMGDLTNDTRHPCQCLGDLPVVTKSSVIDVVYAVVRDGSWREAKSGVGVASPALSEVTLTVTRNDVTPLVGVL